MDRSRKSGQIEEFDSDDLNEFDEKDHAIEVTYKAMELAAVHFRIAIIEYNNSDVMNKISHVLRHKDKVLKE